jgi:hypothetical protein
MKMIVAGCVVALVILAVGNIAGAEDDFYGIIESRPTSKAGTWIVGGKALNVTEQTEFDEDYGPLNVGACADVEMDDGKVEEMESEPLQKCAAN